MTAMSCRKVQGAIARDDDEPQLRVLIARHLRECADCRAHDRHRAAIRNGVLAADDVLDDVTRAQVLARVLEARRRERAGGLAAPSRGRLNGRLWMGGALAAAAALVLAVTALPRAKRSEPLGAPAPALAALEPYAIHAVSAGSVSSGGVDRVELPNGASMRARLRLGADLVLLGPLTVAVRDAGDELVKLDLPLGTLIGEFDGSTGRTLRIATADATVQIVGTRFLVEASPERTRVSVEHGRVRVESRGRVRFLDARQEWTTDRDDVEPLGDRGAALFERSARGGLEELVSGTSEQAAPVGPPAAAGAVAPIETRSARPRRVQARPELGRRVALATDVAEAPTAPAVPAPAAAPEAPPRASRPIAAPAAPPAVPAPVEPPPAAHPELPAPAPPPASPVAQAAAAPQPETASSLYRRAESALGRGDDVAGKKLLEELVRAFPGEPATDSARYELALLAEKAGDKSEALAQTREILRPGARGSLVEPAKFLRCRVYLGQDRAAAAQCLIQFVDAYPQSPHDEVALRALIDLSREDGRCGDARRFAETYLQRHPRGRFAAEAERARSRCD
jgi:hypothetical protein